jgi:phosphoribosyl 1,2-cyclic phosphodiesterase
VSIFVRFWGTRGSIPTPGSKTRRYGGNTSCVEIDAAGHLVILDAGTGLRELGHALQSRSDGGVEAHFFFSHTHWDHIQGFPFFVPAYQPSSKLHVYEIARHEERFTRLLLGQMRSEYFPVTFADLGAAILPKYFVTNRVELGAITVRCFEQTHPGRSFAYRLECEGKSVVYATDSELDLLLLDRERTLTDLERMRELPPAVAAFVEGADLLIADAQYTDEEYPKKVGWGHSRVGTVVDLAIRANVKRLALFHHDPMHSDDRVESIVEVAQKRVLARRSPLDVFAAREDLVLKV